ncbi:hypothetical protein QJS04_geneDACA013610 [Acorus gramineus]|uniref:Uncharacterized protein n=1 Tax=Acorus gramineus TaxID=55184 RepID=A0AAV9AG72_ACOGR|nr:hypothetical protein QJS04_geneDACA013610 [Acorus gramineus]
MLKMGWHSYGYSFIAMGNRITILWWRGEERRGEEGEARATNTLTKSSIRWGGVR